MYFNIKCIGELLGPTNEFERSLVFETGEFERPKFDCIRIEIQIFSMHWMMQNISVLISPRSPNTDIKKPNVFHHLVQAKICISILK